MKKNNVRTAIFLGIAVLAAFTGVMMIATMLDSSSFSAAARKYQRRPASPSYIQAMCNYYRCVQEVGDMDYCTATAPLPSWEQMKANEADLLQCLDDHFGNLDEVRIDAPDLEYCVAVYGNVNYATVCPSPSPSPS